MDIDAIIAISIFLIFVVGFAGLHLQSFLQQKRAAKLATLQREAIKVAESLLSSEGFPADWEKKNVVPVQPGIVETMYRVPIIVEETGNYSRQNEPISIEVILDKQCLLKAWNTTIRLYDNELNQLPFNLKNYTFCQNGWIKSLAIEFPVNLSALQKKKFYVFYSNQTSILAKNFSFKPNTTSWVPSDGDAFSEELADWQNISSQLSLADGIVGNNAINASGSGLFGASYNPAAQITGVKNDYWIRAWIWIENTSKLSQFNLSISDGFVEITKNFLPQLSNGWNLIEEQLASLQNWQSFDASNNGVDYVKFLANSSTSTNFLIDGLRFEKKPLAAKIFAEEKIKVVSAEKLNKLRQINIEKLKRAMGEELNFFIKIGE